MDVGAGDARGTLLWAQASPDWTFVAVDPVAEAMSKTARRAARGGADNLVCVAASAQQCAAELAGVADRLSVVLPWAELLRGVAKPEPAMLDALVRMCRPGAELEVVFSSSRRDAVAPIFEEHVRTVLPAAYAGAGFAVEGASRVDAEVVRAYQTTWSKRLTHGAAGYRTFFRLRAVARRGGRAR